MKKTSKYILMSALTALALGGVCYISTKDYSPIIGNEGKDNEQYILLHKTAQIGDSIDVSGALTSKVSKPYLDYVANEEHLTLDLFLDLVLIIMITMPLLFLT